MKSATLIACLLILSAFTAIAQGPPGGGPPPGGWSGRPPGAPQPAAAPMPEAPKGNSKIRGTVKDSVSQQMLPYAGIVLFNAETGKPVDGAITDDNGAFLLSKVAPGTFYIEINFLGYRAKKTPPFEVKKGEDIALGTILLAPVEVTSDEVVIEGKTELVEEKVDRLVYNAEKDITNRGGDASDVLRKVPLLSVDLEGTPSLRGSSNIRVLINNKPSAILAANVADALRQIPADMIKSVEVITSPSARYDAEGSAGIINIITKKNNLQGKTLSVDMGGGNRASNLGLNGSYRKGKLGLTLGGFGRAMYPRALTTLNQSTLGPKAFRTQQDIDSRDFGVFGNYTLGADYDLSKNQSLSGNVRFGTRNFLKDQNMVIRQFTDNVLSSETERNVDTRDLSTSVDVNLDYLRSYKPGKEWSIAAQYSRNNLTNNFDAELLDIAGSIESLQRNVNDNINEEFTFQTDYQTTIGKRQIVEMGGKGIFRQVDSRFSYLLAQPGGDYLPDNSRPSGWLDYGQNVGASYLSYTFNAKKNYSIKAGLRYEFTDIIATTATDGEIDIPAYSNLVPSLNLSKTFKGSHTVKAAYNRRIQRPGLAQLNPNFNAANPQNIVIGNPALRPELTDQIELSLSSRIKQSFINLSVYGRFTNNAITQVRERLDSLDGAIITTFQNIGRQQTYGSNVFGNVSITKKWSINGGMNIFYAFMEGLTTGLDGSSVTINNSGFTVSGHIMSQLQLNKGWGIQGFTFFRGSQVQLQGRQAGFGMYSLGFKKDFKNKRGSIGLGAENFLSRGIRMRTFMESPLFDQDINTLMLNRSLRVNFSYRIGQMSLDAPKRKRRSVNNDDVKAGEDGGAQQGGGMRQR